MQARRLCYFDGHATMANAESRSTVHGSTIDQSLVTSAATRSRIVAVPGFLVYSPAMHWMSPQACRGCVSTRPGAVAFAVALSLWLATPVFAVEKPAHGRLPDLDRRRENAPMVEVLPQERLQAAAVLQKQVRDVTVEHDDLLRSPRFIGSTTHFLTGPDGEGGAIGPQAARLFTAQRRTSTTPSPRALPGALAQAVAAERCRKTA